MSDHNPELQQLPTLAAPPPAPKIHLQPREQALAPEQEMNAYQGVVTMQGENGALASFLQLPNNRGVRIVDINNPHLGMWNYDIASEKRNVRFA